MAAPINIPVNVQLQNVSQLQRQIQQATQNIRINLVNGNSARSLTALSQPLGRLTGQADEFTKSMDAANARVLAFGASVGVLNAFSNAFKSLIASTIEVEKALKSITVVGDQFAGSTKELGQGLFNVAKLTGQSFAEVSKAALEFSRQGLNLEQTLQRTQDALVLTRLTGLDSAKAVDGLTAAFNAFSKAGLSTSQILNKLAAVDQAFAVSSADLIEGFNRSAAVAQNAGVTFDELAGIITALQQETSRGGAVIGNALKTIFTRIQDKDTLVKLRELGITVEDVQGKILPARQILQNLAKDVQGLGEVTKSGIFKDVAGTFQINQLISLVGDLNKENSISAAATRKAAGATNEAYVANEKLNQSLDAILNKVAVSGKQIGSILGDLGISDNLKGLLDGLNSFLESASNVLQGDDIGAKFAQGLVKGIGSVLTGPGVGLFLAVIGKLTYDLIKFGAQGLKTFFNIGQAAKQQQQIQESIVQTLLRNQNVLSQIVNTQGGQNAQAQAFLNILRQEEQALQNIRTLAGGIAAPVIAAGYTTGDQGLRRRSAGGYLPAQEAADVRRGVGGASPSSKVVTIPNFAFGGGKRGTMIANTSEYIVPNYAGGGSAIFNQDMAKTMGLPPGAKKISASGGFIPNFADNGKTILDKRSAFAMIVNDQNGIQEFTASPEKDKSIAYKFNSYGIPSATQLKNKKGGSFAGSRFSNENLIQRYTKAAIKESNAYALAIGGRALAPFEIEKLSNPGVVKGLVGAIFESGIGGVINGEGLKKAQSDRSSNALIDFVNQSQINDFFGIDSKIPYVEAKYKATSDALKSMANKIYNVENSPTEAIEKRQKFASGKPFTIRSKDFQEKIKQVSGRNFRAIDLTPEQISQLIAAGGIQTNASGGYIPNFASTALQAAISRERSAGVSPSQIYVDQSPALQSSANPMGLMVANRRDEPAGGFQGISRARKEGRNPKTYGAANGFVPNFVQIPQSILNQNTQANTLSITPDPANIEAVNKGFADTAGKIFLLQSALSFLTGAVGDTQNSFTKLAVEASSAAGNISSLLLFGNEIRNIKVEATGFKGVLGNFAKGLGIAGVAFGIVSEGLKFANFAIKEFSGENEKAALSSARLADATEKASIKLSDLSKTRQVEIKKTASEILGTSGYGGLFDIFKSGGEIGSNINVQQNVAELLARGVSKEQVKGILDQARKTESRYDRGGVEYQIDVTKVSDVLKVLEQASESGIGKTLSDQFAQAKRAISSTDVSNPEARRDLISKQLPQIYGVKNYAEIPKEVRKNLQEETAEQINLNKEKQKQQLIDNNINFGERLSLEIAKKRVDSVLEIAKLKIQATTEEEAQIQLQEQTLDLSNRQKIVNEARLKQLDLEKKKQTDIVDSIATAIDKAQQGGLSVSVENLKGLETTLQGIDFSKINDKNYNDLANQLAATYLGGSNETTLAQAEKLINSVKEEQKTREGINKTTSDQISAEENRKLKIDGINQALASQLSTLDRIASTAASIGNLNISGIDLQNAQTKAQVTRLQAQLQDPNLTEGQKNTINAQINGLEKIINLRDKDKAAQEKQNQIEQIRAKIAKQSQDVINIQNAIAAKNGDNDTVNLEKLKTAQAEFENLQRELQIVDNTYASTTLTLDANNAALDIQASQIGKVAGAYASLQKQLEAFRLGAGERVAGAQLGILSATDPNALARSSITRQVELQAQSKGLNDQDYYKFVNQETALREKQYELAVETSNVRKIELQRELDLMQQIAGISAATDEERLAKIKEIVKARQEETRTFGYGFSQGLASIQDNINGFQAQLGQEIPQLFSSNLAQGLNDAISGAKSLKDALRDAATSFLNAITQKNIENIANLFTSGIGGTGQALFKANGGMISGGSGTKDDVPAMLMGGEYVIKKSAVKKYGSRFLDSLNNGGVQAFAAGGGVQSGKSGFYVPGDFGEGAITGKNQLLAFAGQSFTGGQYDRIGGFGMSGASISLEPESARLTAYGRENSPIFERVQQAKEEAFNVYLDQLKQESAYRQQLKDISKAENERKKQLQRSIISAVASTAISAGASSFAAGYSNAYGASAGKPFLNRVGAGLSGGIGKGGVTGQGGLGNLFSGNFSSAYNNISRQPIQPYRAFGGLIAGGSGVRDDVPAMLTGGEFVLNNRATRKLGVQNLNRLNAGATESQQSSGGVSDALISKLDELIQTTRESSKDNVVVNVSGIETGGEKRSDENKSSNDRELQRKIREAVLAVIAQEKRLGGSLNK